MNNEDVAIPRPIYISLRQYAAIHLRVPNSGIDWLDEMIREARKPVIIKGTPRPWVIDDDDSTPTAPDYLDGQWHDWHGGACPVPGEEVEVHYRWDAYPTNGVLDADDMRWGRGNDAEEAECDIIRFRVVK